MLWRLPLSCRSTWTPWVVTMGEDRGNKIMRGRNVRGAIIAVFLLGVLVFASVYYAWTTVTEIFQPVSPPGQGEQFLLKLRGVRLQPKLPMISRQKVLSITHWPFVSGPASKAWIG